MDLSSVKYQLCMMICKSFLLISFSCSFLGLSFKVHKFSDLKSQKLIKLVYYKFTTKFMASLSNYYINQAFLIFKPSFFSLALISR